MKRITFLLLLVVNLSYTQNDIMYSVDLDKKNEIHKSIPDETSYIQAFLDDPTNTKSPQGRYYITKTLIQRVSKDIDWRGTILYTDKNIDFLKIRTSLFSHDYLTIDVRAVKNPTPDKKLITLQFKNINMQWSKITNFRLRGSEKPLIDRYNGGFTGIFFDSTSEAEGSLKTAGECHFMTIEGTLLYLNTGIILSNNPLHNKRSASNSGHNFDLKFIGLKKLAIFDRAGGNSTLKYRGNNRYVLFGEKEKNYDLVYINSDWMHIYPKVADMNKGKKIYNRLGAKLYASRYLLSNPNPKMHNTVYEINIYDNEYIKDSKLKRLKFK